MTAQAGTVYRYFRADSDHDISADQLEVSLDGDTWTALTFIDPVDYPPSVAAADASNPPRAGFVGYWWRALTGPNETLPLVLGPNTVLGRVTDSPEIPHFAWRVNVGRFE